MKKALVLLLALIMLVSAFAACTPPETPGNESKPAVDSKPSDPEETPDENNPEASSTEEVIGNLPDLDLGGSQYVILSRNDPWMVDEVSVEGTNGEPINDAIYKRNLNVETLFNIEIDNPLVEGDDYCVIDALKKTQGPDCPYHIAASSAYTCFQHTPSGLFYNIYDVENIDLDQKYWATKYNDQASIGNAQYFVTGAISLSLRRFIFVTFFNKVLAETYGIENLYDVVKEKRWTLDYQAQIVNNMYDDIDSIPGESEDDFYGFLTNSQIFVDPYVASCDVKLLVKDSDTNFFKFEPEKEKLDNVMEKINNLYYKSGGAYAFVGKSDYSDLDKILEKFSSSEATMITHRLIAVESSQMREMTDPYGILPMPKYDEDQEEYYSLAHDLFTVYGIVSSVNSIEVDNVGAILEAMAIESYKEVTPAYYEIALKGKYSKDEETWQMLDNIVNNLKINGGLLYTIELDDITQKIRTAIKNKIANSEQFLSARNIGKIQKMLDNFQNKIKDIQ